MFWPQATPTSFTYKLSDELTGRRRPCAAGQTERHQAVQGGADGAERHQGQSGQGVGGAEGEPEVGPPRSGPGALTVRSLPVGALAENKLKSFCDSLRHLQEADGT